MYVLVLHFLISSGYRNSKESGKHNFISIEIDGATKCDICYKRVISFDILHSYVKCVCLYVRMYVCMSVQINNGKNDMQCHVI